MMSSIRQLICLLASAQLLSGCVLVTGSFELFESSPQPLEERAVVGDSGPKILLIDLSGAITSEETRDGFGFTSQQSTLARLQAELEMARKDDAVAAVVLRINSPGGTVTASDAAFHELSRFKRERNVPVVAHFLDVAASGGYYVALAADEIVASPTTVTGSVGAVVYNLNLTGLMRIVGVENQTLKSGDKKDIGSPLREMTVEERAILQSVVDGMRDRFVGLVRERRPALTPGSIETVADGRVFGAEQAATIGLVDRVGYLNDAIDIAKRRAGLEEARVVMYRRPREYSENIYSRSPAAPVEFSLLRLDGRSAWQSPSFLYLWMPASE
jgi:protease-4